MKDRNPFLTVTAEDLDRNIAEATRKLRYRDTKRVWRLEHHYCRDCGEKLSVDSTSVKCPKCLKYDREYERMRRKSKRKLG